MWEEAKGQGRLCLPRLHWGQAKEQGCDSRLIQTQALNS